VLDSDLRQQDASSPFTYNGNPMRAYDDHFRTNRNKRRQYGNLDVNSAQLANGHRRESWILRSSARRTSDDSFAKGPSAFQDTNAATQFLAAAQGDKYALLAIKTRRNVDGKR